jgi:hypothetical protein
LPLSAPQVSLRQESIRALETSRGRAAAGRRLRELVIDGRIPLARLPWMIQRSTREETQLRRFFFLVEARCQEVFISQPTPLPDPPECPANLQSPRKSEPCHQ